MKKLHLIKPWTLVTERQHLDSDGRYPFEPHDLFMNCSGPRLEMEQIDLSRFHMADIRSCADNKSRSTIRPCLN